MQTYLPEEGVVVPLLLYSDQTKVNAFGSLSFYPVYATIGNIPAKERKKDEAYVLVGYLPQLSGTDSQKAEWKKTALKSRLLHHCLRVLFETLPGAGKGGVNVRSQNGKLVSLFPLFAYYSSDWPEAKKVTGTRDTKNTALPCHACAVPKQHLANLKPASRRYAVRMAKDMEATITEAKQLLQTKGKITEGRELLASKSLNLYENAFWALPASNIGLQMAPDILHQYFLGMVKALLEALLEHLTENQSDIDRLDEIFKKFPRLPDLPSFRNGVSCLSTVTGREMRSLLFHLPYALHLMNLEEKNIEKLSLEMLRWYELSRSPLSRCVQSLLSLFFTSRPNPPPL